MRAGTVALRLFCHRRNPQGDGAAGNLFIQRDAHTDRMALGVNVLVNRFLFQLKTPALRVNRHAHGAGTVSNFEGRRVDGLMLPQVISAVSKDSGWENFTSSRTSSDGFGAR